MGQSNSRTRSAPQQPDTPSSSSQNASPTNHQPDTLTHPDSKAVTASASSSPSRRKSIMNIVKSRSIRSLKGIGTTSNDMSDSSNGSSRIWKRNSRRGADTAAFPSLGQVAAPTSVATSAQPSEPSDQVSQSIDVIPEVAHSVIPSPQNMETIKDAVTEQHVSLSVGGSRQEGVDAVSATSPSGIVPQNPEVIGDIPSDLLQSSGADIPTDSTTEGVESLSSPAEALSSIVAALSSGGAEAEETIVSPSSDILQDIADLPQVPVDITEHHPPPNLEPVSQSSDAQTTAQQTQILQNQAQANRFPPPGTLVVVQGVVHTTDVPRPAPEANPVIPEAETRSIRTPTPRRRASSVPRSSTPASERSERSGTASPTARNRLSALLRPRPASLSSSSSRSLILNQDSPAAQASEYHTRRTSSLSGTEDSLPSDSDTPTRNSVNTDTTPTSDSDDPPPPASTQISSSSIDVLGTLLSVAAAATAASLLTGSQEPMLNNLSPSPPVIPDPPSLFGTGRSMPHFGDDHGMGFGRTERMRQAWGSLRERLGLRPPGWQRDATSRLEELIRNNSLGTDGLPMPPPSPPPDARERMLSEMARAFNQGLGLNSDPTTPNLFPYQHPSLLGTRGSLGPAPVSPTPVPTLPPAGSFERFLVDLQTDLRVALTHDGSGDSVTAVPSAEPSASQPGDTQADPVHVESPETPEIITGNQPSVPALSSPIEANDNDPPPLVGNDEEDDDDDDMPGLADVSDSESESDFDSDSDVERHDLPQDIAQRIPELEPSAEQPPVPSASEQPPTTNASTSANGASNNAEDDGSPNRIDWWRLYRFPPITAPRGLHTEQGLGATPSPTSILQSTSGPDQPSSPPAATATPSDTPTAPSTAEEANRASTVVPVIVVGLQSAPSWARPAGSRATAPAAPSFTSPSDNSPGVSPPSSPSAPNSDTALGSQLPPHIPPLSPLPSREPTRGSAWHNRAANAFRNLRPNAGNRPIVQGAPDLDGPGTRTFFIFVIGGYYPPDHRIVTGDPSTFDSFESWLDLADLLGSVKPTTATREDIQRSGLEVFKSTELPKYESEGRISSNCIDRCLICLDDYDPEDNIRLLKCRHGFHQTCVDRWLETGKNNCPACRSTGVNTESVPFSETSAFA